MAASSRSRVQARAALRNERAMRVTDRPTDLRRGLCVALLKRDSTRVWRKKNRRVAVVVRCCCLLCRFAVFLGFKREVYMENIVL